MGDQDIFRPAMSPIWVPNVVNVQSELCSSSIVRHTQEVFDAMPTLQGRVLSVRILHAMYTVTLDMLIHVFSLYGSVEKIVHASPLTGHHVLIQYQQHQMASLALRLLQGHSLYQSCCYLEVKYALGSELQVLCPSLGIGNIFAAASTYKEHDAFTMPNERVIEQPTPIQVLDELPSFHDPMVVVQSCSSEVVQASTTVRQGNPASLTGLVMHVDELQLPTNVQDAPDMFEEMPVYDVYEEDTNASLTFLGELRDTASQHKRYDYERPIPDRVEPHGAAKLYSWEYDKELLTVCCTSDEKSTEAAPILCAQEAMVHDHDEKSEVNVAAVLTELNGFEKRHGDEKLSMEMSNVELLFTCLVKAPLNNIDALSWSECRAIADLQYNSIDIDVCIWDPGIRPFFSMCWLQSLTAGAVTGQASSLQTPEPTTWQCQVASASYVWDPGTMLLLYKSKRLLLFTTEKETVPLIPEQWSFWFNDVHDCQIFQKCREMSHLMYWHHDIKFSEIALWLITFNPP
jgi:hypothetical protein